MSMACRLEEISERRRPCVSVTAAAKAPLWSVGRRPKETHVPRRRRSGSSRRGGPHEAVHDLGAAQGPWPRGALAGPAVGGGVQLARVVGRVAGWARRLRTPCRAAAAFASEPHDAERGVTMREIGFRPRAARFALSGSARTPWRPQPSLRCGAGFTLGAPTARPQHRRSPLPTPWVCARRAQLAVQAALRGVRVPIASGLGRGRQRPSGT